MLGAENIEKIASCIVACWFVFTELLPGNALIKSVTVHILCNYYAIIFKLQCNIHCGIVISCDKLE
jgi:hypothetical protein